MLISSPFLDLSHPLLYRKISHANMRYSAPWHIRPQILNPTAKYFSSTQKLPPITQTMFK